MFGSYHDFVEALERLLGGLLAGRCLAVSAPLPEYVLIEVDGYRTGALMIGPADGNGVVAWRDAEAPLRLFLECTPRIDGDAVLLKLRETCTEMWLQEGMRHIEPLVEENDGHNRLKDVCEQGRAVSCPHVIFAFAQNQKRAKVVMLRNFCQTLGADEGAS